MLTKALVTQFLHRPLQENELLTNIYVAQAHDVGIDQFDVLFDHVAPMRPLQKRLRDFLGEMFLGPFVRENIPMHYFENRPSLLFWFHGSRWSLATLNHWYIRFWGNCVRFRHSALILGLHTLMLV